MVRFSCFNANIHSNKPKKTVQASVETMDRATKNHARVQIANDPLKLILSRRGDSQTHENAKYVEQCLKPEEMKVKFNSESNCDQPGALKKSQSLGTELFLKGRESDDDVATGDEIDQEFSCDNSQEDNRLTASGNRKDLIDGPPSQYNKDMNSVSLQVNSDIMNNDSIFSIEDPYHSEKEGHQNSDVPLSGNCFDASGCHTHQASTKIVRRHSLPIITSSSRFDGEFFPLKYSASHSRSCEDLHTLDTVDMTLKNSRVHDVQSQAREEEQNDITRGKKEINNFENHIDDGCDSCNYSGSAKDWIVPVVDEGSTERSIQGLMTYNEYELPSKDFKMKRIEEWVDSLQHYGPLENTNEHIVNEVKKDTYESNDLLATKAGTKISPAMEAAKRYISSLSATASTAQLANHGLAVIPLLSAFVSLRVLNLSGNSIVRITAGALPRGLHSLNLSKNSISTIEGLRDMTRLRVLDLSYNRIVRIGHGLASCSSLKELYLAGNKLSEVEGLHRLLKLSVLDLRFNKISTAKCLGQLAANYNSLQAISLEGNPAQKNVGDEQLKKYLQSLLPRLVYYNRQPIKTSTLKDAADRSVRLGINAHQFDRGFRLDNRGTRKSSHGVGSHRLLSSSVHGIKNHSVASPSNRPRVKRAPLPPAGTSRQHYFEFNLKALNLRPDLSMRRSRSESQLGAF